MKAVIKNLSELTDSQELLEAKPQPFIGIFIYLLLALLVVALTWSYFGEIDIMVKATGIVRPTESISTIKNKIPGRVTSVFIQEGKKVTKGTILYTIENTNYDVEKSAASQQLQKIRRELTNLKKLVQCIQSNKSSDQARLLFTADDQEYYLRYLEYLANIQKRSSNITVKQEQYDSLSKLHSQGAATSEEVKNAKNALNEAELDLQIYQTQTLVNLRNTISNNEKTLSTLEKDFKNANINMKDTVVTAPTDGTLNIITKINKGDLLESGTEVATIVPDRNTQFKVELSMLNKDIANIKVGDRVKYHFEALPYKEYGELTGVITNIGVDARTDRQGQTSFYLVESSIQNRPLYSYKGIKAEIKVGMICEAWVVTKTKKILFYLLEKIDLRD